MKTTLALLIAGLFLFTTPMLALAHGGGRHDDGPRNYKGWVKDRHDHRGDHRQDHWRGHKARKHFKKHVREHRRMERREIRREHRRQHRYLTRHHGHRYYDRSRVIYGVPGLVFHFEW